MEEELSIPGGTNLDAAASLPTAGGISATANTATRVPIPGPSSLGATADGVAPIHDVRIHTILPTINCPKSVQSSHATTTPVPHPPSFQQAQLVGATKCASQMVAASRNGIPFSASTGAGNNAGSLLTPEVQLQSEAAVLDKDVADAAAVSLLALANQSRLRNGGPSASGPVSSHSSKAPGKQNQRSSNSLNQVGVGGTKRIFTTMLCSFSYGHGAVLKSPNLYSLLAFDIRKE